MATRRNSYYNNSGDVSRGLQDILRRNGMQAHITTDANGNFQMIVLGHDSPAVTYHLDNKQAKALMEWGSSSRNSNAYRTFVSIVNKDFDVPANEVVAFNAGGTVNIGQYGYRLHSGEYGLGRPYMPIHRGMRGWGGDFLGWRPRRNLLFWERPDGTIRPGEVASTRMLSNGRGKASSMGFYYKGSASPRNEASQDILDKAVLETKIKPVEARPRNLGEGIPYSDHITADVYFTKDKFLEVLESHGIIVQDDPKEGKRVIQQFANTRVDTAYQLTDEQYRQLTANSVSGKDGVSLNERLKILNNVFAEDFETGLFPITKDMLESEELVSVEYKLDAYKELEGVFDEQEHRLAEEQRREEIRQQIEKENDRIRRDPNAINGHDIGDILVGKGWFTPTAHGRGLVVGEIRVDEMEGGRYQMGAKINAHWVTHSISKAEYDKFLALDDAHRLKLFNDIFREVEIKSASGRDFYQHPENLDVAHSLSNSVDGATLKELNARKGFYREIEHGREVQVDEIKVERQEETGKYKMTAVIDGNAISHEITQKQFDKFMAVDDYQRMKMFSKIFHEVDMKTRPGQGTNIGAAILAALVTGLDVAHYGMDMLGGPYPPHHKPELYASHIKTEGYVKPGVAMGAPAISAANFEQIERETHQPDVSVGRRM